jgi:hypothetical protein
MTTNAEILPSFAAGDDLRRQADSCRQLAGLALTERNKLVWLRLAGKWLELASSADRQKDLQKWRFSLLRATEVSSLSRCECDRQSGSSPHSGVKVLDCSGATKPPPSRKSKHIYAAK